MRPRSAAAASSASVILNIPFSLPLGLFRLGPFKGERTEGHFPVGVPPPKFLPLFATESGAEFDFSGASHPVRPRGATHLRAPPWAGQAKTAGPVCRTGCARPVRGGPNAPGRGRRLSCSRPIRLSPPDRERLPDGDGDHAGIAGEGRQR